MSDPILRSAGSGEDTLVPGVDELRPPEENNAGEEVAENNESGDQNDNRDELKEELEKILLKIKLLEKMGVGVEIIRKAGAEIIVKGLLDDLIKELKELKEKLKRQK